MGGDTTYLLKFHVNKSSGGDYRSQCRVGGNVLSTVFWGREEVGAGSRSVHLLDLLGVMVIGYNGYLHLNR